MLQTALSNRVIYEDNHLIAINKLPGELSQGDSTGRDPLGENVKLYLKEKYNKPGNVFLGVIHRIDQPVSGAILFARTSKALTRMNQQLKEKEVKKSYLALVEGTPDPLTGTLKHFLYRLKNKNITKASLKEKEDSKLAVLDYEVIENYGKYCLLKVYPQTGRQHQIRVQLSEIGHPVKNDLKYGAKNIDSQDFIFLHSYVLEFTHPVKKEKITIQAPIPKYWNIK